MILGGSAHTIDEAIRNFDAGCDYCGVGRMFTSTTKPGKHQKGGPLLTAFLERWKAWPHLAIGGIDATNINEVIALGGRAVAVCAGVCGVDEPAEVVASMRLALESQEHQASEGVGR